MVLGIESLLEAVRTSLASRHTMSLTERRKAVDALAEFGAGPLPSDLDWCELSEVRAAQFEPETAESGISVLYLHGGAFVAGSPQSHRYLTRQLANAASIKVFSLDYRLAPEHRFPSAVDDVVSACVALEQLEKMGEVALVGDSAGATLALLAACRLRDSGQRLPVAIGLISPFGDMRCIDTHFDKNCDSDPIISRENLRRDAASFLGELDLASPTVSPVLGDLTGMPPILIQASDCEALTGDAIALEERARLCGVQVSREVYPGMVHVWHLYPRFVAEADQAIASMGKFLRQAAKTSLSDKAC